MNILLVLISYPAVALLLWWALGEFGDTPEGKILARCKRAALLRAQATGDVLPLIVPLLPLPVPALAVLAPGGRTSPTRPG